MICLLGAKPVKIDVDISTLMVTPGLIKAAIAPRTRAVVLAHYAGAPLYRSN